MKKLALTALASAMLASPFSVSAADLKVGVSMARFRFRSEKGRVPIIGLIVGCKTFRIARNRIITGSRLIGFAVGLDRNKYEDVSESVRGRSTGITGGLFNFRYLQYAD
jgi:hypothetical protein